MNKTNTGSFATGSTACTGSFLSTVPNNNNSFANGTPDKKKYKEIKKDRDPMTKQ